MTKLIENMKFHSQILSHKHTRSLVIRFMLLNDSAKFILSEVQLLRLYEPRHVDQAQGQGFQHITTD
jgi:hypothetical protein